MTNNEIIQALRCCAMHEDKQRCQENLLDKAAEAIERLTAENTALKALQNNFYSTAMDIINRVPADRNAARQDAPVDMIWYMSAEELMTIAEKRLCTLAAKETHEAVRRICMLVTSKCPEFDGLLAPPCEKTGSCNEMYPCRYAHVLTGEVEKWLD